MNDKCFAHNEQKSCGILTVPVCPGEACPFYKSRGELKKERHMANRRLASLDAMEQRYIADKYFDGKMLWLEGGATCGC